MTNLPFLSLVLLYAIIFCRFSQSTFEIAVFSCYEQRCYYFGKFEIGKRKRKNGVCVQQLEHGFIFGENLVQTVCYMTECIDVK